MATGSGSGKVPPRFVPTLTEVVQPPENAVVQPASHSPHQATPPTSFASPAGCAGGGHVGPASTISGALRASTVAPPGATAAPSRPPARMEPHAPVSLPVQAAHASPLLPESVSVRAAASGASLADGVEEYIVHRVMQRVDVNLDQRLREAIAAVIHEQTRSVLPRLREEIESVVRHAVYEAVADELATPPVSSPVR